jgi:hypothetical protein
MLRAWSPISSRALSGQRPVHPAVRAVATTSVIMEAALRAEEAFPPCSLVGTITGGPAACRRSPLATFRPRARLPPHALRRAELATSTGRPVGRGASRGDHGGVDPVARPVSECPCQMWLHTARPRSPTRCWSPGRRTAHGPERVRHALQTGIVRTWAGAVQVTDDERFGTLQATCQRTR